MSAVSNVFGLLLAHSSHIFILNNNMFSIFLNFEVILLKMMRTMTSTVTMRKTTPPAAAPIIIIIMLSSSVNNRGISASQTI